MKLVCDNCESWRYKHNDEDYKCSNCGNNLRKATKGDNLDNTPY